MKTWLENKWDALRTNFWFVPALMGLSAGLLCLALLHLDQRVGFAVFGVGAEKLAAVRSLLAVLTGALVTALSIVFSSTVVVLTVAATQLGPRLLRTYIRDRHNQILIGVFVAGVIYNLTALFLVGRLDAAGGVPNLTTLGAFTLSGGTLIVLVYFIHHVARSIQAPNVILAVARELEGLIRRTYPEEEDGETEPEDEATPVRALPPAAASVNALRSGYIQAVDEAGLLAFAVEHGVIVRTVRRPGDFVTREHVVAEILADDPIEAETAHELASMFIIGANRTATQDVEFVLVELVEIAVRALSPGINDPFTAITCIDRLSEALCLLATRAMPPLHRDGGDGALRVLVAQAGFDDFCNTAFNQIRRHGANQAAVLGRLLEGLTLIMRRARTEDQRASLWRHARTVRRAGERLAEEEDRQEVGRRFQEMASAFHLAEEDEPGGEANGVR